MPAAYEGTDIISYCDEGAIYHAVRKRGISCGEAVYHYFFTIEKLTFFEYNLEKESTNRNLGGSYETSF